MIPEIAPYNNYTGDGSTTKFDFDFFIEDSTQLIVQLTQEGGTIQTLTNNTDYTIHEVGNKNGSYITFPIAGSSYSTLSSSEIISLSLSLPIAQESEYGTSSELDLVSLEYSFDYLTRICQIMNRQVVRALKVAEGSNIDTDELALDVEKIADISGDVSTVAEIAADVTAVKNNATNITTVAGSIANVNAVGESIANVNTVATDLTNIDTVAGSISNVNAVGSDIANVNAVAGSITNIDTIKEDLTNIDNVADDLVNINTVAGSISNVDTVAAISSDITAVKNNATNINAVAADLTNINAVAADLTNIDAASSNAQLAKDWANKMNGTVDGYEYSAKYYAQQAAQGQVQANWNESDASSKAYIWNKPTIPDAQIQSDWNQSDNTKKDFIKNKPTIPDAQIQSDWAQSNNASKDFIKNKPDLSLKQDTLVSGTNIKTINNNSILGSGNLTLDGGSSRQIGEIVTSTIPLTDAGLHLLDGDVIQGGGSYNDFVDYIADLYDSGDYTDIFETEANWQQAVTDYGVCGKFVYDDVNNTVRLPKITGFIEGTTDLTALGDLVEAGLPNITGGIATGTNYNSSSNSALYNHNTGQGSTNGLAGASVSAYSLDFDASRSNSIYGNSTTVQPQAIKVLYYIVVANTTKTEIEVDIDEIATDLNGKVDKANLVDISESFSLMTPDYSNGISVSAGVFTPTKNGVLIVQRITSGSDSSYVYVYYGSDSSGQYLLYMGAATTGYNQGSLILRKNDNYFLTIGGSNTVARFYPFIGEE